jgi:hypothetical protein
MNGNIPLKNWSPMCTTFDVLNQTMLSPSVCPWGAWKTRISSPLNHTETPSAYVITGSPDGAIGFSPSVSRLRTFSCARIVISFPNTAFAPV